MDDLTALPPLLTSLGLGLMMGLERELRGGTSAGLRTFALVAIAGTVAAMLSQQAGLTWLVPALALGLIGMMTAADVQRRGEASGSDTTTTVALLLCFLFGALLWYGHLRLTVALALGVTALLYFKTELHDATRHLTRQDIVSFLQFAAISFVVLPVLPDHGYGPYGQLNPFRIWLMVVLTAGISLAGYAALRVLPRSRVVPLLGLLGGLVSSTATTLVFARQARAKPAQSSAAQAVIVIANLVVPLRIAVLALVIAPQMLQVLGPVLALGLAAGIAWPLRGWLRMTGSQAEVPNIGNPTDLRQALAFGGLYAVVLVVSAAVNAHVGATGVYGVAAISGLGDMDAIAISTLQMGDAGRLTVAEASWAIVIALCANMTFKATLVWVIAGRALALQVARQYLAAAAGLIGGAALLT